MSRLLRRVVLLLLLVLLNSPVWASSSLHQTFDELLKARVTNGQVDYPGIATDPRFADYLETLKTVDATTLRTREERLAFWINAYNALVIQGILAGGSPSSFFGRIGFFKTADYEVGGRRIDLYDLEHEIIRPLGEPRIHFAIVCASRSCPKLRSEAYDTARLDQQLDDQAREFINNPERNRFDAARRTARLSMIFEWFKEDFEKQAGSVPRYIAPYLNDRSLASEFGAGSYKIEYLEYDWNLNGLPPRRG
ncbi:MAG: DUF547 domain-containing protein [Chromatiales bacterium]